MTAKSIHHRFVSAISDGTDATLVRPSNWNDDHDLWLGFRSVTTTSDTLANADHLSIISYNNAGAIAVTLPAPSGGNFPLGWKVKLVNLGLGGVTVTPASTINGSATAVSLAQGEALELYGTGTSDYVGVAARLPAAPVGAVRYDTSQALSTPQQAVASRNIGASSAYLINGKIIESHAANAATFALKTLGGADPSATDPVQVWLPDGSIFTITAALSIVLAAGSTFAQYTSTAFRLWFAIINDGGTPRLAVRQCSFLGSNRAFIVSTYSPTGTTSSSNAAMASASVPYTNTVAVSNKPYRTIAYADYDTGLASIGNYNVSPTRLVLVSGDTPQAGAIVQGTNYEQNAQSSTTGTTLVASSVANTFGPWCLCNFIDVHAEATVYATGAAAYVVCQLARAGSMISLSSQVGGISTTSGSATGSAMLGISLHCVIQPPNLSAAAYAVYFNSSVAGTQVFCPVTGSSITINEIMG
jgi:hypothetical protein